MKKAVLVLDCGATNIRAVAVDIKGAILSSYSLPNRTIADPFNSDYLIWDVEEIWQKFVECIKNTVSQLKDTEISALTITTFGVDGAAMKADGCLCYPVISWQCGRTVPIMENIDKYIPKDILYSITGLQAYHFNTINKLVWLKENRPDVITNMDFYVMMPSIIIHKLTGVFVTDTTMAGTTMLTDLYSRDFSDKILSSIGINKSIFPTLVEPGTVVGNLTSTISKLLGIGTIPVVAAGHDTQFAVIGSGAGIKEPVLSSGTWEILMARCPVANFKLPPNESGITVELDAKPGIVDLGVQWVASGVLEWVSNLFYPELNTNPDKYNIMIKEASLIEPGSNGVSIIPELFPGGFLNKKGMINGINHTTSRAHIYRATLEALSYYSRQGIDMLKKAGNFESDNMICVGGGAKNKLWNQIRANVLDMQLTVTDRTETTVIGAAMYAMAGIGIYNDVEEAANNMPNNTITYQPNEDKDKYQQLYNEFKLNNA